ncbi:hypothetical protein QE429_001941 [Bacillus sp. SORGH_AS 510]|nr:hypothetical protein [Bacillus sp. SORGH_AS_0510]
MLKFPFLYKNIKIKRKGISDFLKGNNLDY